MASPEAGQGKSLRAAATGSPINASQMGLPAAVVA